MAIAGRKAIVKVTGAVVVFAAEAATDVLGDGTLIQITNPAHRIVNRSGTFDIYRNGSLWGGTSAPGSMTGLNRLNGSAILTAPTPGGVYFIQGVGYLPAVNVIEGKSWMYELSAVNTPVAKFQDIWQPKLVCLKDAKGKIGLWKTTDETLVNLVLAGAPLVVDFYDDAAQAFDMRMWAQPLKASYDALVNALVNHDFEFESTPDVDGRVATNV